VTAGIPRAGYHSVSPRLVVSDVVAQVEFLHRAFDATGEANPGARRRFVLVTPRS
jgi:hypothetical protein